MYSARISRKRPTAFIILIDQSGSMADQTVFQHKTTTKALSVSFVVNRLIGELLHRSRREDGYRDYFDLAVLGYHEEQVVEMLHAKNHQRPFVSSSDLLGMERSEQTIQQEGRLPNGKTSITAIRVPIWIEPMATGRTPMFKALSECYRLCNTWCSDPAHYDSYPPTVFNITDGEATDGNDTQLLDIAQRIRSLGTSDGKVLLINIHISSDADSTPVLFPASTDELPDQRYARLLYDMSSEMPPVYNPVIENLQGTHKGPFRGISYNAGMLDLINIMNIGSVSVNLLF